MFDAIIENLFIIIPVVLFIGFRILAARKKQEETADSQDSPVVKLHFEEDKPVLLRSDIKPRPGAAKPKSKSKTSSLSVKGSNIASGKTTAASAGVMDARLPAAKLTTGSSFPRNLDYLPALKRAVVFTEILSPPKALREE